MQGLKETCQTLYSEQNSFDWFRLLTMVSEHNLPNPLDASQFEPAVATKLRENFQREAVKHLEFLSGFIPDQENMSDLLQPNSDISV